MAAMYELQQYPVNAKYFLQLEGMNNSLFCRTRNELDFIDLHKKEVEQLKRMTSMVKDTILSTAMII
jgi:4-hydroxy-tetrahydrodipicolinate synthase